MNRLLLFATTLIACYSLASCKKDDEKAAARVGEVRVSVSNMVGSEAVKMGGLSYTNAAGNRYSVEMLKYYISHFTLIRDDSVEIVGAGHELIDEGDSSSRHFTLDSIPNGRYVGVRFYFGVDYDHNHSGDQFGDLDPMHGMIWTWNTGYIFFKHEGRFVSKQDTNTVLSYHLGTDIALTTVTKAVPAFEISGNTRNLSMRFDLNRLYAGPPAMDFNNNHSRMSTSEEDEFWILTMRKNLPAAFSVTSVE